MDTFATTAQRLWAHAQLSSPEVTGRGPSKGDLKSRLLAKCVPEPFSGCWLWTEGCFSVGYGAIKVGGENIGAHVASFLEHGGILTLEKPFVLHSCHTRLCINPAHLRAGTPLENAQDMVQCGRIARGDRQGLRCHPERAARGERHANAKLTNNLVLVIRGMFRDGRKSQREIAAICGVAKCTISRIAQHQTWRHV